MIKSRTVPVMIALTLLGALYLTGCAATPSVDQLDLPSVNRVQKWSYKKCFDCPEVSPTIVPTRKKGWRYFMKLKDGDQVVGKIGIGEEYHLLTLIKTAKPNRPLNSFIKEKLAEYRARIGTNDTVGAFNHFLEDAVIITLSAEYNPWSHSYGGWRPYVKIRVAEKGEGGKWRNVPPIVKNRIQAVAKAMFRSGYIDKLKREKQDASRMDVAYEGQHLFAYGLPNDETCYEINVVPSKILDNYLNHK